MDLWSTYRALPRPSPEAAYTIAHGAGALRLARSSANQPALLIATTGSGLTPRRLANLTFSPPLEMIVARADGASEHARFAVLVCTADDAELERYFCRVVGVFFGNVGDGSITAPSAEEVERTLDGITTLFSALNRAPRQSVQGLWAELAIIAWARVPEAAISAWHSEPTELHDFAIGSHRLEIKSTLTKLREHHFQLDQLSTAITGETVIASLILQQTPHGVSVFDLVEQIGIRVGDEATARLETIIADSLGRDWPGADADDVRFDLNATRQTLKLYRAVDVPTVPQPLPAGIKRVQFVADLSNAHELPLDQARALAPLYADLLPELFVGVPA
ncbi:PD-(D/E)XK motif protein [Corallococcus terminator]|uniref:PD-(D/E)XK motif protein n=1 Tax=Corallococcus terminator TaxID=2316733 RepID=A0A3A8JC25_9BACT|nr:PD-(D/E)XK motif protein [Corallococcus terminator]